MTMKQIQKRLDSLILNVFPRHFSAKYTQVAALISADAIATTEAKYSNAADGYIVLASKLLHTPTMLDYLAMCADPIVVFVVFKRYQKLVDYFANFPPDHDWHISTTSSIFLLDLFIGEWHNVLNCE